MSKIIITLYLFLFRMILNEHRYLFVDGSFMLKRHNFMESKDWINSDRDDSKYTAANVARRFMYSVNKLGQEVGGVDKIFILWDMWDGGNGYYTTQILKGKYKDSRKFETKEDAEKPDLTEEEKREILDNAKRNEMQIESKRFIINHLGDYGMPSIRYGGYEADNLVWVYSSMLAFSDKTSVFSSSDGDWKFNGTSPSTHVYKVGMRGGKSEMFKYDQMVTEIPEDLRGKVSLYDWKAYWDSLDGSHNDMRKTRRDRVDTASIIENIVLRNDYSGIEDLELFKSQYSTFRVDQFPGFQRIIDEFPEKMKSGTFKSLSEFREFSDKSGLGISDSWYTKFTDRLDPMLYGRS